MLDTYHERMGDQSQQQQTGAFTAGWGRIYGNSSRQSFARTVSPTLNSSTSAFQIGTDVYASTADNGAVRLDRQPAGGCGLTQQRQLRMISRAGGKLPPSKM